MKNIKTLEEQHELLVDQLSVLANRPTNHLEGWFSDTVNALLEGESINNVCIKGKWPNITWNGEKLEIGGTE